MNLGQKILIQESKQYFGLDYTGAQSIPVGAETVSVTAIRESWPDNGDNPVLEFGMCFSFDGANSWIDGPSGKVVGKHTDRSGAESTEVVLSLKEIPEPNNISRSVKVWVRPLVLSLNTSIYLECL